MNINDKTYREVGNYIIYYLSKVSRSSEYSLVCRGCNGSVADNDVRVIARNPDRKVDIRGLDNN